MAIIPTDVSTIAEEINTYLQDNLAAKLATLNAEYNDGITLTVIPTRNYHLCELSQVPAYPLVCTIPDPTEMIPEGVGATSEDFEYHRFVIALALTATKGEDALKRRAVRMLRAFQEILEEHRTLGDQIEYLHTLRKNYNPLMTAESALVQEAQLEILTASVEEW